MFGYETITKDDRLSPSVASDADVGGHVDGRITLHYADPV